MMNRLVALILLSCLIVDPALASALTYPFSPTRETAFAEQALAVSASFSGKRPGHTASLEGIQRITPIVSTLAADSTYLARAVLRNAKGGLWKFLLFSLSTRKRQRKMAADLGIDPDNPLADPADEKVRSNVPTRWSPWYEAFALYRDHFEDSHRGGFNAIQRRGLLSIYSFTIMASLLTGTAVTYLYGTFVQAGLLLVAIAVMEIVRDPVDNWPSVVQVLESFSPFTFEADVGTSPAFRPRFPKRWVTPDQVKATRLGLARGTGTMALFCISYAIALASWNPIYLFLGMAAAGLVAGITAHFIHNYLHPESPLTMNQRPNQTQGQEIPSDRLADIDPIPAMVSIPLPWLDRMLQWLVEKPLVIPIQMLRDKGIETVDSSANRNDIERGYAYITIQNLQELNQRALQYVEANASAFGVMIEHVHGRALSEPDRVIIKVPVTLESTVDEVRQKFISVALTFAKQKNEPAFGHRRQEGAAHRPLSESVYHNPKRLALRLFREMFLIRQIPRKYNVAGIVYDSIKESRFGDPGMARILLQGFIDYAVSQDSGLEDLYLQYDPQQRQELEEALWQDFTDETNLEEAVEAVRDALILKEANPGFESDETIRLKLAWIENGYLPARRRRRGDAQAYFFSTGEELLGWWALDNRLNDEQWSQYIDLLIKAGYWRALEIVAGMIPSHMRQQADMADTMVLLRLFPIIFARLDESLDRLAEAKEPAPALEERARRLSVIAINMYHVDPSRFDMSSRIRRDKMQLDLEKASKLFKIIRLLVRLWHPQWEQSIILERALDRFPEILNPTGPLPRVFEFTDNRENAYLNQTGREVLVLLAADLEARGYPKGDGSDITINHMLAADHPEVQAFMERRNGTPREDLPFLTAIHDGFIKRLFRETERRSSELPRSS